MYATLATNLIVLASTIIWQGRIQGGLAQTGFDSAKFGSLQQIGYERLPIPFKAFCVHGY